MSVPNVNCKIQYIQNEEEISKSSALTEKYSAKRKFYSSNQTQDYLTYVNTGSKEKIDYIAYSGNDEKSCGVFGKNGLLTMSEKKKLRQQLRETKSVIWDCLLTFQPEFGQRYCNDFEQAYEMMKREMPRFLKDAGFTDAGAGNIHGVMQLASAAPGLLLIPVISRMKDQRVIAAAVAGIAALGTAGLAAVPNLAFIWGSCIGFGAGATIILGLMFIGLRTNNMLQAASLSGMAQGVGYMLAACGSICAGAIHDMTQSWAIVFYGCAGLCVLLGLIGLGAGRDIRVSEDKMAERDGF